MSAPGGAARHRRPAAGGMPTASTAAPGAAPCAKRDTSPTSDLPARHQTRPRHQADESWPHPTTESRTDRPVRRTHRPAEYARHASPDLSNLRPHT